MKGVWLVETNEQIIDAVKKESCRIEEDVCYSAKGHFNAESLWTTVHLLLGTLSTISSSLAGVATLYHNSVWAVVLAFLSATLISIITFLAPQKIAGNHGNAGREYNALKHLTRKFREIDILVLRESDILQRIEELSGKRDSLNSMSQNIPRGAYEKAKKDIDNGNVEYKVDRREKNNDSEQLSY